MPGSPSGVSAIGIDPGKPQLMLVGGRRGISRSIDAGKSWKEVGAVRGRLTGLPLRPNEPDPRIAFATRLPIKSSSAPTMAEQAGMNVATGFGSAPILAFAGGSNKETKSCMLYVSVESREVAGQSTVGSTGRMIGDQPGRE